MRPASLARIHTKEYEMTETARRMRNILCECRCRFTCSTVDRIYCCKDIAICITFLLALMSSTCARTAAAIQVTAHEFVILDRTTHLSYWTPFILIGRDIRIHPIRVTIAWVIAVIWVEIIIIHWEGCIVLTCPRLKKYPMRPSYIYHDHVCGRLLEETGALPKWCKF